MTVANGMRWAVGAAWLVNALLLERILTLGGITDTSAASQNSPLFLAVGLALIILAVGIAILIAADARSWPTISMAASAAYVVAGVWLRLENDDDSGAAIVIAALVIAALSGVIVAVRRRDAARSTQPPTA